MGPTGEICRLNSEEDKIGTDKSLLDRLEAVPMIESEAGLVYAHIAGSALDRSLTSPGEPKHIGALSIDVCARGSTQASDPLESKDRSTEGVAPAATLVGNYHEAERLLIAKGAPSH